MHEHAQLSGRNQLQELAATTKEIGTCNSMLVKYSGAGPLWDIGSQQCPLIFMSLL